LVSLQKEEPLAKSPSQILYHERQRETLAKDSIRILHQETDTRDFKSEAKVPDASSRASKKKNPQSNIRRQLRFVASPQRGGFHSRATDCPVLRGLLEKSRVPDLVATPPSPSMATISPCTPAGQNLLNSVSPCLLAAGPPKRPVRKSQICGAIRSRIREQSSTPYRVSCSPPPRPRPPDPSLLPEPARLRGSFGGQEDSMQGGVSASPPPKIPEPSATSSKQLSRSQSEIIQLLPQQPRSRSEIRPAPVADAVRIARRAFAEAELALLLMDCTHRSMKPKRKT